MDRRSACYLLAAASIPVAKADDKRIRVAVFGTGHAHAISKIRTLRRIPEFEFAGICGLDGEPRAGEVFQGVRWLSAEELLNDPSIELVAIESRVQQNLKCAKLCVEAGKFVHLDKAPGEDLPALSALLHDATRRKLVVQMGYQWRYHPAMQASIKAAKEGWLGKIYAMRATIDKPIGPADREQLAAFRSGMMFELGCHLIDRAVDLFGRPKKVTGILRHESKINDNLADNTLAVLEFENAMAEIYVAAFQPSGNQYRCLEILGTNGRAIVQPFDPPRLLLDLEQPAGIYRSGRQTIDLTAPGPIFSPDFAEMARIIRHKERPSYSTEHDLIAQETLLKACGVG
jgi:predicted dehydrogenase